MTMQNATSEVATDATPQKEPNVLIEASVIRALELAPDIENDDDGEDLVYLRDPQTENLYSVDRKAFTKTRLARTAPAIVGAPAAAE